jgi:hypothetical protein
VSPDLSPHAVALLLVLHSQAIGKVTRLKTFAPAPAAVDELRDAGLAVRITSGVFLTPAGVDRARRMKGEQPVELATIL